MNARKDPTTFTLEDFKAAAIALEMPFYSGKRVLDKFYKTSVT